MIGTSDLLLTARVVGSLMVVVAFALLAARLARRAGVRASGVDLKVVERIGLTRDAAAVVLEAGGRRLLLGVSAHGVTMLADLGQDETIPIVARPALEPAPTAVVASLPRQPGPWHSSPASQGWADSAEGRAELGPGRRYDRDVDRHRDDDPVRGRRDDLVQDRYDGLVQDRHRDDGPGTDRYDGPALESDVTPPPPPPLTRRAIREATAHRRLAVPPTQRGSGSAIDPRTWRQGIEALRDLTARRG